MTKEHNETITSLISGPVSEINDSKKALSEAEKELDSLTKDYVALKLDKNTVPTMEFLSKRREINTEITDRSEQVSFLSDVVATQVEALSGDDGLREKLGNLMLESVKNDERIRQSTEGLENALQSFLEAYDNLDKLYKQKRRDFEVELQPFFELTGIDILGLRVGPFSVPTVYRLLSYSPTSLNLIKMNSSVIPFLRKLNAKTIF